MHVAGLSVARPTTPAMWARSHENGLNRPHETVVVNCIVNSNHDCNWCFFGVSFLTCFFAMEMDAPARAFGQLLPFIRSVILHLSYPLIPRRTCGFCPTSLASAGARALPAVKLGAAAQAANQKPQHKHPPFDACSAWTGASTSFTWPSACGLRHTLCSSGRVSFSTVSTQRRGTDRVGGRQKVRPLRLMPLRLTIAPGMSPYTLLSAPVRCDDVDISLSLLCSQICSR